MATNGLLSVSNAGQVELKVVAGCDGYYAEELRDLILEKPELTHNLESLYDAALELGFGSEDCLVVISKESTFTKAWFDDCDELNYRKNFNDTNWNPRRKNGACDCLETIEF